MDTNHHSSPVLEIRNISHSLEDGLVPKLTFSHCQIEEETKIYEDISEDESEEETVAAI